jgi:hypothetical protein
MPEGAAGGSTDMGNVSQYLPSIHPMIAFKGVEAVPHHQSFAEAAVSSAGDAAALDGAIALALAAIGAVENTEIRERLVAEQSTRLPYRETDTETDAL